MIDFALNIGFGYLINIIAIIYLGPFIILSILQECQEKLNEQEKLRIELEKLVEKYEADIKYLKAGDADVEFLYTLRKVTQEVKTQKLFRRLKI